ncbi:MAG TPA: hypothetical protein VN238_06355, partial [Solirubrobacteraceae bacterium]|nr:hypothetical protein [Solirubrobacteraceae bacterium]
MRRIAMGVLAAAVLAAGCGGSDGDDGSKGEGGTPAAAARTATTPAPDPLAVLREQTERRCTEFTRDVLRLPLPRTARGERRWFAGLKRLERHLVGDLRRLDVPPEHAARYRAALNTRSRSLRKKNRTPDDMERAAAKFAAYSPHACRYWGVRALGTEGVQFQSDQSSYCYEDLRAIEKASQAARAGRISKARASRRVGRTLRRSARLMRVEAPRGAARRWRELR